MTPERLDELLDLFADALAPRIAERVASRLEAVAPPASNGLGTSGFLTIDEFVALLPATKKPETWKRWVYERVRRGEIPGATKLGGSWHFDPAQARAWMVGGERVGE